MSSRQEEKERRRQERLAQEQAEARSAGRRKRLQLAFGGVLALALVAGIVLAVVLSTGSGGGDGPTQPGDSTTAAVKLPVQAVSDIEDAAKAASCKLTNPAFEGTTHETKAFKASDYKTNPPTSGNHAPDWYEDGIYAPGDVPDLGKTIHPLEHGRIIVQYKPGTPETTVSELEALLAESEDGYHMMLFENSTGMTPQVAATAWTHSLTCDTMNPKVFDAIRTFRTRYIDKGPETVP